MKKKILGMASVVAIAATTMVYGMGPDLTPDCPSGKESCIAKDISDPEGPTTLDCGADGTSVCCMASCDPN